MLEVTHNSQLILEFNIVFTIDNLFEMFSGAFPVVCVSGSFKLSRSVRYHENNMNIQIRKFPDTVVQVFSDGVQIYI